MAKEIGFKLYFEKLDEKNADLRDVASRLVRLPNPIFRLYISLKYFISRILK